MDSKTAKKHQRVLSPPGDGLFELSIGQLVRGDRVLVPAGSLLKPLQEKRGDSYPSAVQKFRDSLALKGLDVTKDWAFEGNASFYDLVRHAGVDFDAPDEVNGHILHPKERSKWIDTARRSVTKLLNKVIKRLRNEVEDHFERFQELMYVLGITINAEENEFFMRKLEYLALQGKLIAAWKFAVTLAFSRQYETDLPVAKYGIPGLDLLPARFRTFLGRWRSDRGKRSPLVDSKMYTFFQGFKKGLLPVRLNAVSAQLRSHASSLTRDGQIDFWSKLQSVAVRAREAFKLEKILTKEITVTSVSSKASVESNFASNGSVGFGFTKWVHGQWGDGYGQIPEDHLQCSYRLLHTAGSSGSEFLGFVTNRRRFEAPKEVRSYWISDHELALYGFNYSYSSEKSIAIPACILEPMKVRVITKPRALQYAPLQCLQGRLWRRLAKHPSQVFRYTGEPVTEESLSDFAMSCRWRSGAKFVSGDYSAATDNLKGSVSLVLAEILFGGLRGRHGSYPELVQRIMKSLTGGSIQYGSVQPPRDDWLYKLARAEDPQARAFLSCWKSQLPADIEQQNGQLMGNVLSFPLLCLANLCCFWLAVEEYEGRNVSFRELPPVRINGDDILFMSPDDRFYQIWAQWAARFGFELSVGKNLVSEDLMQINSAMFRTVLRKFEPQLLGKDELVECSYLLGIREVPFVNFGLITNRKKNDCSADYSLERTGLDTRDKTVPTWVYRVSNAPKIVNELVRGLHPLLRDRALELYANHNQWIRKRVPRLPWDELLDTATWANNSWLLSLQSQFRSLIPTDPMGALRQFVPTASVLRRITPVFDDDDCFESYRRKRNPWFFNAWEEKDDEWSTISLRRESWRDLEGKEQRDLINEASGINCLYYEHDFGVTVGVQPDSLPFEFDL